MINNTPGWRAVDIGDMNIDGVNDILYQNNSNGQLLYFDVYRQNWGVAPQLAQSLGSAGWVAMGIADQTHDGRDDLIFTNITNGANVAYDIFSNSFTALPTVYGWLPVA